MKRAIIAFLIGVAVTLVAFVTAAFGGGACHCSTPSAVLFPYTTFFLKRWEAVSTVLLLLQFPGYALAVATPATSLGRRTAAFGLTVLHVAAAVALVSTRGSVR
jgi:hypothetical protein